VIINKQVTPYDNRAALIIRANVDDIFSRIMEELDKDESEDSSD
jgi:NAD-dependent SIR2 family protein deacetylase